MKPRISIILIAAHGVHARAGSARLDIFPSRRYGSICDLFIDACGKFRRRTANRNNPSSVVLNRSASLLQALAATSASLSMIGGGSAAGPTVPKIGVASTAGKRHQPRRSVRAEKAYPLQFGHASIERDRFMFGRQEARFHVTQLSGPAIAVRLGTSRKRVTSFRSLLHCRHYRPMHAACPHPRSHRPELPSRT